MVQELAALGPEGLQVRLDLTGSKPVSVCLFHGVHSLYVEFAEFVPRIGPFTIGKPTKVVTVVMACHPSCGARAEWRS